MATIEMPDHRERTYRLDASATSAGEVRCAGIRVVTEFSGDYDRVVTAFP
jgi:hypothetical protein